MSGTTPIMGWTIPTSVDEIAGAPGVIADGLKDIENSMILDADSKTPADLSTTYPKGMSIMSASAGSWPGGATGGLVSFRRVGLTDVTYQLYMSGGGLSNPYVWFRAGSTNGWSPWVPVTSTGTPSAVATGQVTIAGAAGVRSAIVMLPASRFTAMPRIQISNNATSRPDVQTGCSIDNASATQFTVYVNRTDANAASVNWTATQGVE